VLADCTEALLVVDFIDKPFPTSGSTGPRVREVLLAPADGWSTGSASIRVSGTATHQAIVMFAIIGIVVTFGAVLVGYLMEHGNVRVLMQPAGLLIIGGAGVGTVLIANPLHILKQIASGVGAVFKG